MGCTAEQCETQTDVRQSTSYRQDVHVLNLWFLLFFPFTVVPETRSATVKIGVKPETFVEKPEDTHLRSLGFKRRFTSANFLVFLAFPMSVYTICTLISNQSGSVLSKQPNWKDEQRAFGYGAVISHMHRDAHKFAHLIYSFKMIN